MSKHKVSELTGAMLDAAVTLAEGAQLGGDVNPGTPRVPLAYSTDWEYGGPIIERERIAVWHAENGWAANMPDSSDYPGDLHYIDCTCIDGDTAQTPLIAAMRAWARAKLGDEVDLNEQQRLGPRMPHSAPPAS